jgi:hypothetical protein
MSNLLWGGRTLNLKKSFVLLSAFLLCCSIGAGQAHGQPMAKQLVGNFGVAFTQATVSGAKTGFAGLDLYTGKMLTNGIALGIAVGYDIVSFNKVGGIYQRFAVIPILAKAKYNLNIAPLMQVHASVAGGAFNTVPHLATGSLGGISDNEIKPGGSVGAGFDYWMMGTKGLGGEIEYSLFPAGGGKLFSYFAVRLNLSFTKL